MFHVHMHDLFGTPDRQAKIDSERDGHILCPDFWKCLCRKCHTGAVILSRDALSGRCWYPGVTKPIAFTEISICGATDGILPIKR